MERNYGIDLFRITSMFMVVVLHVIGQGGALASTTPFSGEYWMIWLFEIACYCAVNCFALISGYVMYRSKARFSKILGIWLQTIFYTLLLLLITGLFIPKVVTPDAIIDAILPITRNHYWYISAYFGMYILTPVLNIAINNIEKKTMTCIIAAMFLMFSVMPTFLSSDPYVLKSGYSMIWLSVLYLVGGYIARYDIVKKIKSSRAWLITVAMLGITFLSKFIPEMTNYILFGLDIRSSLLISYTSPTITVIAVFLLIIFSKLNLKEGAKRIIKMLAPATLGVYLIHVNKLVWDNVILNFTKAFNGSIFVIPLILLSAVGIYMICSIIEIGRIKLFKLMKVDKFCILAEEKIKKIFDKISDKF